MSPDTNAVMNEVLCEQTVSIIDIDVQGVVEYISWDRTKIVVNDNKHIYRIKTTDNGNEVSYMHDYGPDEYEHIVDDVTLKIVSQKSHT